MRLLRDRDSADDAQRFQAITWSLGPAVLGAIVGSFLAPRLGVSGALGFFGGAVTAWILSFILVTTIAEAAGRAAGTLYAGRSQPMPAQFSLVESLIARGHFEQAARELHREAGAAPEASAPRILLARLLRDQLKRPDEALHWFRDALDSSDVDDGTAHLLLNEIVQLCRSAGSARRALPALARVAAERPDTQIARWARDTMHAIRQETPE